MVGALRVITRDSFTSNGMTDYKKLTAYAKREERERILGIIEYYISELSDDTTAERLAKRWLRRCATTVERLDALESHTRK